MVFAPESWPWTADLEAAAELVLTARPELAADPRIRSTSPLTWPDAEPPLGPLRSILLVELLEHVVDPSAVLRTAASWLEPGGELTFVVPNLAARPARLALLEGRFPFEQEGRLPPVRFFTAEYATELAETVLVDVEVRPAPGADCDPDPTAHLGFTLDLDPWADTPWLVVRGSASEAPATAAAPAPSLEQAQDELLSVYQERIVTLSKELRDMRSSKTWRWREVARRTRGHLRHRASAP